VSDKNIAVLCDSDILEDSIVKTLASLGESAFVMNINSLFHGDYNPARLKAAVLSISLTKRFEFAADMFREQGVPVYRSIETDPREIFAEVSGFQEGGWNTGNAEIWIGVIKS
jgi:hypothetical protein